MAFELDTRLEESSFPVIDLPLCHVRLKNNRNIPWMYLIPRQAGLVELHDVPAELQPQLMAEVALVSRSVKTLYKCDKINMAAYGNMVPQLHIHLFARYKDDHAWPKPVWAVQQDEIPYTETEREVEIERLRAVLTEG